MGCFWFDIRNYGEKEASTENPTEGGLMRPDGDSNSLDPTSTYLINYIRPIKAKYKDHMAKMERTWLIHPLHIFRLSVVGRRT